MQLGVPLRLSATPGDLCVLWDIWMSTQLSASVDYKKWGEMKWRRFLPADSLLSKMNNEACLMVRPSDEKFTIITISEKEWQKPAVVASVKGWVQEMNEATFRHGCIIEKFQYIYGILMVTWWGSKGDVEAMKQPLTDCEDWLVDIIRAIDASCLEKCKKLLSSKRFLSPLVIRESTPGLMDLDVVPITLQIPESPSKQCQPVEDEMRTEIALPLQIASPLSKPAGLITIKNGHVLDNSMSSNDDMEECIVAESPRKRKRKVAEVIANVDGEIDSGVRKRSRSTDSLKPGDNASLPTPGEGMEVDTVTRQTGEANVTMFVTDMNGVKCQNQAEAPVPGVGKKGKGPAVAKRPRMKAREGVLGGAAVLRRGRSKTQVPAPDVLQVPVADSALQTEVTPDA
ncbi:hypothetical protein M422DRAFT_276780 [Sphaerobolus stellatus SS14]|uniref:Uncharacterized protein n=1 Tax=Sphaerobolus stellatus (strain SS14) TaxID=990650 RepID=A0A0C9UB47_SPHS4|nr:hypothetical protein M422DRAFT_276780 [Sphaerobolus stellatus SS14]